MGQGKLLVIEGNLEIAGLICNIAERSGFVTKHTSKDFRDVFN